MNVQEEMQVLIQSAQFLTDEYMTEKILNLLGDADKVEEILNERASQDFDRIILEDEGESE